MSDDHSKVVPLLPIPNRTVKRLCANDSAGSRVKVGHRQTLTASKSPARTNSVGAFVFLGIQKWAHLGSCYLNKLQFSLDHSCVSLTPVPYDDCLLNGLLRAARFRAIMLISRRGVSRQLSS